MDEKRYFVPSGGYLLQIVVRGRPEHEVGPARGGGSVCLTKLPEKDKICK